MKHLWPLFVLAVICAVFSVALYLFPDSYSVPELTREQAEELVKARFSEDAEVLFWHRVQVAEDVSLWRIEVAVDGGEYEMMLDENDEPLADNFLCAKRVREIEAVLPRSLSGASVRIAEHFSYADRAYRISAEVSGNRMLTPEQCGEYYAFLQSLHACGVEQLILSVSSPDFLLPEPERNLGIYGYSLDAEWFDTDMSQSEFEQQYAEFIGSFFWDEQVFLAYAQQLSALGYRNIDFYISDMTVDTIVVSVYCEQGTAAEGAAAELEMPDDEAFRIDGREICYRLEPAS